MYLYSIPSLFFFLLVWSSWCSTCTGMWSIYHGQSSKLFWTTTQMYERLIIGMKIKNETCIALLYNETCYFKAVWKFYYPSNNQTQLRLGLCRPAYLAYSTKQLQHSKTWWQLWAVASDGAWRAQPTRTSKQVEDSCVSSNGSRAGKRGRLLLYKTISENCIKPEIRASTANDPFSAGINSN